MNFVGNISEGKAGAQLGAGLPEELRRQPEATKRAFTLVELLVVVAVIAILAALLLPALARGRSSAWTVQCANNLRQLGFATHMYWDENFGNCFVWKIV